MAKVYADLIKRASRPDDVPAQLRDDVEALLAENSHV